MSAYIPISLRDRQTISVNHPLCSHGVTLYQTNWGINAVQVRVNNSPIFQIPMAPLETSSSNPFGRLGFPPIRK